MSFKRTLALYYLVSFFTGIFLAGPVMVPFYEEWGGINQFQIQILQSWFTFILILISIPIGAFADRTGRKRGLVIGLVLGALVCIYYGLVRNFWAFALGEVFSAIHVAFIRGASSALIYHQLVLHQREHQKMNVFSTAQLIHMLGLACTPPIANWLIQYSLNYPLLFTAIPMLLATIAALFLPESNNGRSKEQARSPLIQIRSGISYIVKHPRLLKPTLAAIVTSNAGFYLIWLYPDLVRSQFAFTGDTPPHVLAWITRAYALLIISQIIVIAVSKRLSDRLQHYLFAIARYMTFLSFLAVSIHPNSATIIFALIMAGGFGLSYWPLFRADIQEHLVDQDRSALNAAIDTARDISLILISPLIGLLIDTSLSITAWILTGVAALGILILPRPPR